MRITRKAGGAGRAKGGFLKIVSLMTTLAISSRLVPLSYEIRSHDVRDLEQRAGAPNDKPRYPQSRGLWLNLRKNDQRKLGPAGIFAQTCLNDVLGGNRTGNWILGKSLGSAL